MARAEVIKLLSTWHSVHHHFDSSLDPDYSRRKGTMVGEGIFGLAGSYGMVSLLIHIVQYFEEMMKQIQHNISNESMRDIQIYAESGKLSWHYVQTQDLVFFTSARERILLRFEVWSRHVKLRARYIAAATANPEGSSKNGRDTDVRPNAGDLATRMGFARSF